MILNDVILNNTVESEPVSLTAAAYLLSATVSGLGSQRVESATSEVCHRLIGLIIMLYY